jgi:hypothetical protein
VVVVVSLRLLPQQQQQQQQPVAVPNRYSEYCYSNRLCYRLSERATLLMRLLVKALTCLGLVVVLLTKLHYTLDVVIAV